MSQLNLTYNLRGSIERCRYLKTLNHQQSHQLGSQCSIYSIMRDYDNDDNIDDNDSDNEPCV